MPELSELITQWGYLAIFFTVILGNLGVPVPEEAILVLAGYFVWDQQLWLPAVLVVGVVGAATGDNIGYWIGRHYGARAVLQYGHWFFITPDRFDSMQRFVSQYGAFGVFFSRFLPGLRFMAGPLAGTTRMPFLPFLVSNVLGAAVYVPLAVAVGYALSYGVGDYVKWVQRLVGRVEHVVLIAAIISAVVILGWRALRARGTSSSLE
jgi:membrane protein DedA with SNARE-associated domain